MDLDFQYDYFVVDKNVTSLLIDKMCSPWNELSNLRKIQIIKYIVVIEYINKDFFFFILRRISYTKLLKRLPDISIRNILLLVIC